MLEKEKKSRGNYLSLFMNDVKEVKKIFEFSSPIEEYLRMKENFPDSSENFLRNVMDDDLNNYLPEDILVKVDRAAMSSSLETRMPFLNHKIVEMSRELPFDNLYNSDHEMKVILKKILSKKLPKKMFDREKQGFSVPIVKWLKGDLHDWMYDSLSSNQLEKTNFFNKKQIVNLLNNFTHKNQYINVQLIWNILMLQNWAISSNDIY